jgi:hypothetical protein
MATTTKTPPKPPPVPTVADAERVICDLEKRKADLLEQRAADDRVLGACSYQAHAHGTKEAVDELDRVTENILRHDTELRSINAAIAEATERVKQAQAIEAQAADRAQALQLRKVLKDMRDTGEACDVALALLVEAGNRLSTSLDAIHAAGFSHPHHQQLLSMAERATVTKLGELPWKRAFPVLPPGQRTSFARFISEWEHMLQNAIAAKLGEKETEVV